MNNPLKKCRTRLGVAVANKPVMSLLVLLISISVPVQAQDAVPARLSDWLLAHPSAENDYLLGLSWRVPGEVPGQEALRAGLLRDLDLLQGDDRINPQLRQYLRNWIAGRSATGRVPIAMHDVRWLQVNPNRDPELLSGHSVVVPQRPATVTVLGAAAQPCQVSHEAYRRLMDYVNACAPETLSQADWVWVVQPDGRVQRFGVAIWNLTPQGEPAPGAWIWAPSRKEDWPESLSDHLAEFLATQGPAPDVMGATPVNPVATGESILASGDPRGMGLTSSDWGGVGLMQTPSARMREAGELTVNISRTAPYTNMNVFLQPFDWMETGFRYSTLSNRLYGAAAFSGAQSYKDKSIDVKFRLLSESAYLPQLALGWRDLVGTGLFSGEYLVASKRTGDFDWSLGLGWGYVGNRGDLKNPLGYLSQTMNTRRGFNGQTGQFSISNYFRGSTSLFGGVQYQTPWSPLVLKLEYDGNNYQNEPFGTVLKQSSPFNFGAVYKLTDGFGISLGVERGNTAMLGLTLQSPLNKTYMPKVSNPPSVPVAGTRPQRAPDWAATSAEFTKQTDWPVNRIEQSSGELRVTVDDADAGYWRQRLDRAIAVLHRDAPADVERFTVAYRDHGLDTAEHQVDRDAWVKQQTQVLPPSEQQNPVMTSAAASEKNASVLYRNDRPAFENNLGGGLNYSLGGPDTFALYQFVVKDQAKLNLGSNTWVQGGVQAGVLDNYNKYNFRGFGTGLPRVRTQVREYKTSSRFTMPNLQMTHTGKLGENNFYSLYGGFLEEMYAGVGGEWLYRPFESSVALGVDVNAVQQRDFKQDLGLLNYKTVTGHATLYWDTGWNNIQAKVSAGRYLAKDKGVTLELSRYFDNGAIMAAGLTKTNVAAAQFGEGSFDKWIRFSIPFEALSTRMASSDLGFIWQPLIRDGGAKLWRDVELYNLTKTRDERTLQYKPAPLSNDMLIPADHREAWTPPPKGIEAYTRVAPQVPLNEWKADDQPYQWRLKEALYRQQFRDIDISVDADARLLLRLSNEHMHPVSLAVGRAVRTALLNAPQETKAIRVTFLDRSSLVQVEPEPVVEYDFADLERLKRYLDGSMSEAGLASAVKVNYLVSDARQSNPLDMMDSKRPIRGKPSLLARTAEPVIKPVYRVKDDLMNGFHQAMDIDWLTSAAIGGGIVLASSLLDKPADRIVQRNGQNAGVKAVNRVGNTLVPLVAGAGAVVAALSTDDPLLSRTGYTAIEAGGTALALSLGSKYVVGRARPMAGQGSASFHPFAGSANARTDGFPSGHAMIVWATLTPFAVAYDEPWLYGVASLTNLARVGSRNHWVSDTVAGSVLGYGIGKILWESSRSPLSNYPSVGVNGRELILTWDTP
ncbi:MAG: YjbH domain-containing protein [Nitrosomonadales bacterium]|nr:YjbH domain-containing protein [Nitrosomonadales bacterium]